MKIKTVLLLALITLSMYLPAQVTIGISGESEKGALLDIKESIGPGVNATRGLGMPRVALSKVDELYPMYGTTGSEKQGYTENKALLKSKHRGLAVYNLTESEDFVPGFYVWDGSKWLMNELIATPPPEVESLVCSSARMYPETFQANTSFRCIFTLPYIGGNGGHYSQFDNGVYVSAVQTVNGTPTTTNFKVRVAEGTLATGSGMIMLIGEGTLPSATDPFLVEVNLFGHTCSFTMNDQNAETSVISYKSGTFLNVNASSTTGEVSLGNIAIRYNNGFYEYKLIGPNDGKGSANLSWLYRKVGSGGHGYGVYGRYYPAKNGWNSIGYRTGGPVTYYGVQAIGNGSANNAGDLTGNANINLANRDIAVAHFFIQTDVSHDVYRVTFNANTALAAGANAPATKSAVSIIIEQLEDHGDGGPDLD